MKTIKDLEGRKIAFTSPKSVTEMLVIMSLTASGIDLNKVERISTGGIGAGLTALRQGGVAAAPIMDPIWAREQGRWRPVFFVKDILPKMTQTVGITTTQFAREQPQKLRAIIAGRRKGVDFTYANPEEAGRIFAEAYELPRELGVRAVKNMVEVGYWSRGEIDTRALDAMVEGLRIIGEVEGPVDWSRLVDRSFLPPDLQATG